MNLRRLKHTLLRLSLEEKVIGLGTLAVMVSSFLPWYSTNNIIDNKVVTEYGLSGDLGVIGFVIFLMSLLGLFAMVSENMHLPFPKFGYKREGIVFFFTGQAAFLTLLTMAIYTKRSLGFTEASLRFGIWAVLAAAFFSALAAFALIRKTRKKEVLEFFDHEAPGLEELDEEQSELEKIVEELPEEALTFQEDVALMEEIEKEFNEAEPLVEEKEKALPQETPSPEQSNYFKREAGVPFKSDER